jgi:flagellar motor switch protein FliM
LAARNHYSYYRSIRLAPALGDWTEVHYQDQDDYSAQIFAVKNPGFNALSRELLSESHTLHYRLSEQFVTHFSDTLDIKIELHTILAQQFSYRDFLSAYPEAFVQMQFEIPQFGSALLLLDLSLADSIVNRITGGSGESSAQSEFTDIELGILQTQTDSFSKLLSQSWRILSGISPECLSAKHSRLEADKRISFRESVTVFSAYMYLGGSELKRMIWVYPSESLRRLLHTEALLPDPIRPRLHFSPKTLKASKVSVSALLGRASLTMKELRELQVGDIIPLDTQLTSPVDVILGGNVHFTGQAGVSPQGRLCVQLIFMEHLTAPPYTPSAALAAAAPVLAPEPEPEPAHILPLPEPDEVEDEPIFAPSASTAFEEDAWAVPPTPQPSALEEEDAFFDDEEDQEDTDYSDNEALEASQDDDGDDEDDWDSDWNTEDTNGAVEEEAFSTPSEPAQSPPKQATNFDDDLSWDNLDDHF